MFAPEPGCSAKRSSRPDGGGDRLVAIVTAMPEEFEAIAQCVSRAQRPRMGEGARGIFLEGKMASASVLLAMTGDGRIRAERGVSFLLGEFPVSLLVGAGAAGSLVPSLRAGEVVVAERVVDEEGGTPLPDVGLVSRAVALGAKPATVVTLPTLICSSKEKGVVAARFGLANPAPAVVDTESAAWARAAAGRSIPFLILRGVSDAFEEDLPGFLSSCASPDGSVDRAAVARKLLIRPAALPVLLRARRQVRVGAARVGLFLEKLLLEKI
jgi:adenosylhomocysteine nucleosidase